MSPAEMISLRAHRTLPLHRLRTWSETPPPPELRRTMRSMSSRQASCERKRSAAKSDFGLSTVRLTLSSSCR
jgi:hypothetical protein